MAQHDYNSVDWTGKLQGPVVQSVVSLTKLVKGHFVNCFNGFNIQYSDIFC